MFKDWHKIINDRQNSATQKPDEKAAENSDEKINPSKSDASVAASQDNKQASAKTPLDNHILTHPAYEELAKKLTDTEALVNKYWNDNLRAKADLENYQRRMERDLINARKYALEKIAAELITVVDNLERCLENKITSNEDAVQNIYAGVELTLKMFLDVLHKFSVKQFNPLGENFNPEYHTAMATEEKEGVNTHTVLKVIQKGYMLQDRLLRPALVIVAK